MKVTALITLLLLGLLLAPLPSDAQQPGKVPRIGVVVPAEPASPEEPNIAAFRQALRDLGYVEGQTIAVEYRYAHGELERMREFAAELVGLTVDVIVAGSGPAALAAKHATQTIPIVMAGVGDPVGIGLGASLAQPGGNVTGMRKVQDKRTSSVKSPTGSTLSKAHPAILKPVKKGKTHTIASADIDERGESE